MYWQELTFTGDLFLDIMGKKTHSAVYLSIYFSTVILLAVSITLLILGENASRTRLLTQEEDGLLSLALFFHPSWLL